MSITTPIAEWICLMHSLCLGASVIDAKYAESLMGKPYRTRGVAHKAAALVRYDRCADVCHKMTERLKGQRS